MSPKAQRIAIAESVGIHLHDGDHAPSNYVFATDLPDYLKDCNAMQSALTQHGNGAQWITFRSEFTQNMLEVVRREPNYLDGTAAWYFATATPMQLAEAFLRTIGKWEGGADE